MGLFALHSSLQCAFDFPLLCTHRTGDDTYYTMRTRSGVVLVKYAIEFSTETTKRNIFFSSFEAQQTCIFDFPYKRRQDKRQKSSQNEWVMRSHCLELQVSPRRVCNNLLVPENAFTHVCGFECVAGAAWRASVSLTNINLPLIKCCNCYRNLLFRIQASARALVVHIDPASL